MQVLITGGLSFIGVNLAREFLENGVNVLLYDIIKRDSSLLQGIKNNERLKIIRGDVTNLSHLLQVVEEHEIDGIVQLAAMLAEDQCREFPTEGMRLSVYGTQNVLEAMRLKKLNRCIYVSTGAVFGHRPDWKTSLKETDWPSPLGLYAFFKYLAEELTKKYRFIYRLETAVVRIAYVYGPDLITPEVTITKGPIPYFLYKALKGEKVAEKSGGDFSANYSYVKDVAHGIYLAYVAKNLSSDIYHIGSGMNYMTKDVVNAIKRAIPDSELSIGPGEEPYSLQTPVRGPLDIERARKELGYQVSYSLVDAISDYAAWMREELQK
jgi:nucleoside-diphosphate-sugar epimerase